MPTPTPPSLVVPFAINAGGSFITNPIPVDSQIPVTPGAASFNDGFPPLTMTSKTSGGIPPSGANLNGILFMISAHTAWVAAGGGYEFNDDVVTVSTGYPLGAVIRGTTEPATYFYNLLADNDNDPNVAPVDWLPFSPFANPTLQEVQAPTAGAHHNVAVEPSTGYLDVNTAAGDATFTGLVLTEGQIVTISNTGANLLTLAALTGSTATNQFRIPTDISLVQNQSITVRKSAEVGKILVY